MGGQPGSCSGSIHLLTSCSRLCPYLSPTHRFPFYFELKIAFVIWLLSPYTKGSSVLYRKFVHPTLSNKEKVCWNKGRSLPTYPGSRQPSACSHVHSWLSLWVIWEGPGPLRQAVPGVNKGKAG